jgi:hypothetical protein
MEFYSTIDEHKRTPDVSVDQHVRKKQLELSKYVSSHKTVYLEPPQ